MPAVTVSQISICNSALVKIGALPIASISDNVKSAISLNAIYAAVRSEMLRAHPWGFAKKRATLNPNATQPPFEYTYSYDIPQDCVRILLDEDEVESDTDIDWTVESGQILSNATPLDMIYISNDILEGDWDPCFAEAMAWRLARDISYTITQSSQVFQMCAKAYDQQLALARSYSGAEGKLKPIVTDLWSMSRRRGLRGRADITKM